MAVKNHGVGLTLNGLTKRYGSVTALDNVDLTIAPGEFMTFLGPSGSGKTTTLNLIAGFVEPDDGQILMGDRSLVGIPPHRRNIGVVFQNYALFPHLRVTDNVAFPLKQRKLKKSEITRKVGAILETVGLSHLASRYPRELSGGQQQRVALARALVFDPQLLLLDEPLGALDKRLREGLQLEIKRIHQEVGVTFIFVTHDQEEALVMSDRIAVFNEGGLEHVATAHELYENPRTLFAAQFLGNSNVMRGSLVQDGDDMRFSGDGFNLRAPATGASAGERAALVIRPEQLRVVPAGHVVADNLNSLTGTVSNVIYLGGRQRLIIDVRGQELMADEMAPQFQHRPGDAVVVTWNPAATSLVDPGPATGVHHVADEVSVLA
ncbi:ABC transporter ATP-binding protein [Nocardioides eburneiflavus]|uniref:Spermidine/putrescine import ATP-binding protein PotA n=1 Tax=Nocardioides eburneiflavus TaxID=2518372 RepID=A0A4Z1CML2_9ACTN|nr:ABC transporter ATP-binding protein [Nocardioides eburneiflavus]TGN65059.1 ABC transporter ATP-binding protein [Nocardioides eburneiflavus]